MHLIVVPWLRATPDAERDISAQQIAPRRQHVHAIDGRYPIAPVRPAPRRPR